MQLRPALALPLFLLSLSAQADAPAQLAQAAMPFPWATPYGWPQAAWPKPMPPRARTSTNTRDATPKLPSRGD